MKLSEITAKLTCMKGKAVRVLAAGLLAGAVLTAAVPAAKAQRFAFGVQFGGPRYYAPPPPRAYGYGYGGYWEHRRWEEERAREAYRYRYGRGYYGRPYGYGYGRPY